jgi:hypothetical protein
MSSEWLFTTPRQGGKELSGRLFVMAATKEAFVSWCVKTMSLPVSEPLHHNGSITFLQDEHQLRGLWQPMYTLLPGWDGLPYRQVGPILDVLRFTNAVFVEPGEPRNFKAWRTKA